MSLQDAFAEPDKDTRNLAAFTLAVVVQDVQDTPPIFTSVPPVTVINNTIQKVGPCPLAVDRQLLVRSLLDLIYLVLFHFFTYVVIRRHI
jgi:hypothetical protein